MPRNRLWCDETKFVVCSHGLKFVMIILYCVQTDLFVVFFWCVHMDLVCLYISWCIQMDFLYCDNFVVCWCVETNFVVRYM